MEISLIMSTYNPNLEYLLDCLNSIENQSFRDFELVLVNDGSKEEYNFYEILKNYRFHYKLINNKDNLGVSKSLNIAIMHARGKYIAKIDDDDVMETNRLEVQYKKAQNFHGAIFSNVSIIDSDGQIISLPVDKYSKLSSKKIKGKLIRSINFLTHSTFFIPREVIANKYFYNSRYVFAQDYAFYLSLFDTIEFAFLEERLVRYRINNNRRDKEKELMSILNSYISSCIYVKNNISICNVLNLFWKSLIVFFVVVKFILKDIL